MGAFILYDCRTTGVLYFADSADPGFLESLIAAHIDLICRGDDLASVGTHNILHYQGNGVGEALLQRIQEGSVSLGC
jgi:hypothetical protein